MSFLNPVSEPVLLFSSKDTDAPQIINTRAIGDIKTVFKACLVTGYGEKTSAGWSMLGETNTGADFISPDADMVKYKISLTNDTESNYSVNHKINDTAKSNSTSTNIIKQPSYTDKSKNAWYMLVTKKGFYFIESFFYTGTSKQAARLSYYGKVKSALKTDGDTNFLSMIIGFSTNYTYGFFESTNKFKINISNYSGATASASNSRMASSSLDLNRSLVAVDFSSCIYYRDNDSQVFLGQQPGLVLNAVNDDTRLFDFIQSTYNNRPVLVVPVGGNESGGAANFAIQSAQYLIYTDKWDY
ncbi:hypothetical protein I6J32_09460 [Moraxella osloensis]|nr:hypothetical protein [Moraxella osloensis]QRO12835.1 hypothetical protein I6J32_09460 [Moraxella osloensis]